MIRRFKSAKERRKACTRAKIKGASERPRLSVFRSNRLIFAQIIDDEKGRTLVAASELDLQPNKKRKSHLPAGKAGRTQMKIENAEGSVASTSSAALRLKKKPSKTEKARLVGKILAQKALAKEIKKVVFDRGSYKYHGRIKALAEGAREGGLVF